MGWFVLSSFIGPGPRARLRKAGHYLLEESDPRQTCLDWGTVPTASQFYSAFPASDQESLRINPWVAGGQREMRGLLRAGGTHGGGLLEVPEDTCKAVCVSAA